MNDLDLSKEVGDFLDDTPPAPEEPPVAAAPEPPVEPVIEPEPPGEPPEPPVEEPPAEPPVDVHPFEPAPADPPAEPPLEPAEPPVEEPITDREQLLMDRLEKVTGERLDLESPLTSPAAAPAEPAAPVPPVVPPVVAPVAPAEPASPNFFGDMTLDDVIDDPEKFTQVMTNVAAHASTVAEKQAVEKVLKSIPQLVVNYVTRHATMSGLVSDFYKENSDLVGAKRTVAAVANEVAAENPEWDVAKVFNESATRTRKVLGLAAKAAATPPADPNAPVPPVPPGKRPAFAKQGSRGAPPGPGLKGLEKEIDELITD